MTTDTGMGKPAMRLETTSENIARSILEGVFPKQLDPIMVPVFSKEKVLADRIGQALYRSQHDSIKLDESDLMLIVNALSHYAMAEYGEAEEPSLVFGRALTALPKLAAEAGCHVGIKVTELKNGRRP